MIYISVFLALVMMINTHTYQVNPFESLECPADLLSLWQKDMRDEQLTSEQRFSLAFYVSISKGYNYVSKMDVSLAEQRKILNRYSTWKSRLRLTQDSQLLDSKIQSGLSFIIDSGIILTPHQSQSIKELQEKINLSSPDLLSSNKEIKKGKKRTVPSTPEENKRAKRIANKFAAQRYRDAQIQKKKIKEALGAILEKVLEENHFMLPPLSNSLSTSDIEKCIKSLPSIDIEKEAFALVSNISDLASSDLIDKILCQYHLK